MVIINEGSTVCVISDTTPNATQQKITILFRPNNTVTELFKQVSTQFQYDHFELLLKNGDDHINLNEYKEKTLVQAGLKFEMNVKNNLIIKPLLAVSAGKGVKAVAETTETAKTTTTTVTVKIPVKTTSKTTTTKTKKVAAVVEPVAAVVESVAAPEEEETLPPRPQRPNNVEISVETSPSNENYSDDDLILGASASPTETETTNNIPVPPALPMIEGIDRISSSDNTTTKLYSAPRQAVGYVGLVNQAMTCYLNSLLQALFMTPEFRNALYNWEYDGVGELKSIPYQLQKLFLNLQTSKKNAVETTDLTKSFGWDSTEAWQQHDIQELCRVMFDALEQKFKNTKQADLINRLYEGKMIDYVKCLECGTEKSREDKFLDIPLPVRPFGSNVAYGSVEEAMRAFVQPETLDGNNQYFCEKCNKKCDAHKGLKFSKFPYILTLHLKRFDFDYQTMHRIKLNDKVTFPQSLNLNGLVINPDLNFISNGETASSEHESVESAVKLNDDCSTTDSGSALEEDVVGGGTTTSSQTNQMNYQDLQEDDEGIDMSTSTDNKIPSSNQSGPYVYELFAIMIHSGSASGGHYYAYIKDFDSSEWYCFNDQNVTTITQEDIQKSFGGSSNRAYYSGAYSLSTNAYMLMYRQVDRNRNCLTIKDNDFPDHIRKLLLTLEEREENERKNREYQSDLQKLKIFCYNPKQQRMTDCKVYMINESTLMETLTESYSRLNLENIVPIDRCRLVAYDSKTENCEISFDGKEETPIGDIMSHVSTNELLIEYRDENTEFEVYVKNSIFLRIYKIDLATSDLDGPVKLRCVSSDTIGTLKKTIGEKLNLNSENIILSVINFRGEARILESDDSIVSKENIYALSKIFITVAKLDENIAAKFKALVERFDNIIILYFTLPKTDKDTLEKLSIPAYEPPKDVDEVDAMLMAKPTTIYNTPIVASTSGGGDGPQQQQTTETECNSEDSSLSDGDRTLVESVRDDLNLGNDVSDKLLSTPEDCNSRISEYDILDSGGSGEKKKSHYFRCEEYTEPSSTQDGESQRMLKIWVDKKMLIGKLKEFLEPIVKVQKVYFKIFRLSSAQTETECSRMTEGLSTFKDGERLIIELGRVLRKGEYKLKLYYLNLSEVNDDGEKTPFICEWIFRSGANVGQTKREILSHIITVDPKYDIPYDKCRLRKKNLKNPSRIFTDDVKFDDDITLTSSMEVILQDLRDGRSQPLQDLYDVVLFIRKWSPSEMVLHPYYEITIKNNEEFRTLLSSVSGIPAERIEYAKVNTSFERNTTPILSIHSGLNWTSQAQKRDDSWPLNGPADGHIYYYRDSEEKLKELTEDEKRELTNRDSSRLSSTTYSPRRERGLKIYLDSSPKKRDD